MDPGWSQFRTFQFNQLSKLKESYSPVQVDHNIVEMYWNIHLEFFNTFAKAAILSNFCPVY